MFHFLSHRVQGSTSFMEFTYPPGFVEKTHPTHPPLEKENESTQNCQKVGGYVIVFRRVIQDFKAEK